MRRDPLTVRAARPADADAVVPLMHASSRPLIDATFGADAAAFLRRDFRRGTGIFGYASQLVGVTGTGDVVATVTAYDGGAYTRLGRHTARTAIVHFRPLRLAGVARRGIAVAGLFTPPRRDGMFLANLCVAESHRGAGAGSVLIGHVVALARTRRLRRVELDVSFGNVGARRLYERFGFTVTGEKAARAGSALDGFRRMELTL